ncbi:MAG TPA: Stp1/IreP family PP2C-type Ser/Thr phosphatase [Gemmatimonadales bacterium]|nr:Stp1/IreP family PP2C-type Ser/Thr phosphatase [Gemmatimonadales bacterium]
MRVSLSGRTDLGRTRDHNEDTFLVADLSADRAELAPDVRDHEVGERGSLLLVADGMGGAAAGELASSMAAGEILDYLRQVWAVDPSPSGPLFARRMREAVEHANRRLHEYATAHPEVRGMGTTATAAGVIGQELYVAQIGDSRAYLIRSGTATQLTRDQSLTQRLVEAGELTEEQAEASERRNIILQALGPDAAVRVDVSHQLLRRGDVVVLCSDGLSGVVRRQEIAEVAGRDGDLEQACRELIEMANERGGADNITVVVARFDGPGLAEPDITDPAGYAAYESGEAPVPAEVEAGEAADVEVLPEVPLAERKGLGPWPWYVVLVGMVVLGVILLL